MIKLKELIGIFEQKIKDSGFLDFAGKRMEGAKKISNDAKEKGGLAILTHHHFVVKLPYYQKAKEGNLEFEQAKAEYKELLEKLYTQTNEGMNIEQIEFQELVGKIEVLGELLIKEQNR
jgi:hypothetical protein